MKLSRLLGVLSVGVRGQVRSKVRPHRPSGAGPLHRSTQDFRREGTHTCLFSSDPGVLLRGELTSNAAGFRWQRPCPCPCPCGYGRTHGASVSPPRTWRDDNSSHDTWSARARTEQTQRALAWCPGCPDARAMPATSPPPPTTTPAQVRKTKTSHRQLHCVLRPSLDQRVILIRKQQEKLVQECEYLITSPGGRKKKILNDKTNPRDIPEE